MFHRINCKNNVFLQGCLCKETDNLEFEIIYIHTYSTDSLNICNVRPHLKIPIIMTNNKTRNY